MGPHGPVRATSLSCYISSPGALAWVTGGTRDQGVGVTSTTASTALE